MKSSTLRTWKNRNHRSGNNRNGGKSPSVQDGNLRSDDGKPRKVRKTMRTQYEVIIILKSGECETLSGYGDLETAKKAEKGMRRAYGEEVKDTRVQRMTESEIRRSVREDMMML